MSDCPACGGPLQPWRTVPAGEPGDPRRYPLERCRDCGTAVTGGAPPGAEAYTSGVYAPQRPRALPLVRALQRATVGQPVRMLLRAGVPAGARVLDVGAGAGRLVAALVAAGYDAAGIEPSARSAALAQLDGRAVARRAVEEHSEHGLDAAVLWHVIEHLEEPGEALARVAGWLRPGGVMLVGAPNLGSLQARLAGDGWLHLDVPRHRTHLTRGGLRALLEGNGLALERTVHMVWEQNPSGMWMALLYRMGLPAGLPFHLVKRNTQASRRQLALLGAGLALAPAAVLAECAAAGVRRGGTVAVVARRV